MSERLKLRAEDAEDLRVIAACLQDALIPLSDIDYAAGDRRFMLVANRFRWENCTETADMLPPGENAQVPDPALAPSCASYERVNCGIAFENIATVKRRGLDLHDRGRILELLTMDVEGEAGGPMAVVMLFAGGAAIRLEGNSITCRISDLGEPWPTQWRPYHPAGDTA